MDYKSGFERTQWIEHSRLQDTNATGYLSRNIDLTFVILFYLCVLLAGASNGNFRENICSEDDLRTRIFGTFVVKFLACVPLLGFLNIYKMV